MSRNHIPTPERVAFSLLHQWTLWGSRARTAGGAQGRVLELEDKLSRAEVIDIKAQSGSRVMFGAKVELVDEETEEKARYQIVGPEEAEIQNGLLSIQSPLARAILGKEAGESVEVATPRGTRYFEILAVNYD